MAGRSSEKGQESKAEQRTEKNEGAETKRTLSVVKMEGIGTPSTSGRDVKRGRDERSEPG